MQDLNPLLPAEELNNVLVGRIKTSDTKELISSLPKEILFIHLKLSQKDWEGVQQTFENVRQKIKDQRSGSKTGIILVEMEDLSVTQILDFIKNFNEIIKLQNETVKDKLFFQISLGNRSWAMISKKVASVSNQFVERFSNIHEAYNMGQMMANYVHSSFSIKQDESFQKRAYHCLDEETLKALILGLIDGLKEIGEA